MYDQDRSRTLSLTAIITLAGLVIVIISAHSLFPELLFYSIVVVLIGVIVIFVGRAFFWERTSNYIRERLQRRKRNALARRYFDDFRDFVERFTSLREFGNSTQGIIGILNDLAGATTENAWISNPTNRFSYVVQNPVNNDLKHRLNNLHFRKSEINGEFLSSLAREFENYMTVHKQLYVDLVVTTIREMGIEHVSDSTKRAYREYRDEYNQFVIAYTEFAKETSRKLGVFNANLPKASEP